MCKRSPLKFSPQPAFRHKKIERQFTTYIQVSIYPENIGSEEQLNQIFKRMYFSLGQVDSKAIIYKFLENNPNKLTRSQSKSLSNSRVQAFHNWPTVFTEFLRQFMDQVSARRWYPL